jgi:hypothetical protein
MPKRTQIKIRHMLMVTAVSALASYATNLGRVEHSPPTTFIQINVTQSPSNPAPQIRTSSRAVNRVKPITSSSHRFTDDGSSAPMPIDSSRMAGMVYESLPLMPQLDSQPEERNYTLPLQSMPLTCPGSLPTPPTTRFEIVDGQAKGSEHAVFKSEEIPGDPGCAHGLTLPRK